MDGNQRTTFSGSMIDSNRKKRQETSIIHNEPVILSLLIIEVINLYINNHWTEISLLPSMATPTTLEESRHGFIG